MGNTFVNYNKTINILKSSKFISVECSMQGCRDNMEDEHIMSVLSIKGHYIFAVFDGHGGNEIAKHIRSHLIKIIEENEKWDTYCKTSLLEDFYGPIFDKDTLIKECLQEVFMELDRSILDSEFSEDRLLNCGTTANVVLLTPTKYYCANIGDSRSILDTECGTFYLSVDHKPNDKTEYERIHNDGGYVMRNRVDNIIATSRAFADFRFKKDMIVRSDSRVTAFPDVIIKKRTELDKYLILGCDGVWDAFSNLELTSLIKTTLENLDSERELYREKMRTFIKSLQLPQEKMQLQYEKIDKQIYQSTITSELDEQQKISIVTQIIVHECSKSNDNVSLIIVLLK